MTVQSVSKGSKIFTRLFCKYFLHVTLTSTKSSRTALWLVLSSEVPLTFGTFCNFYITYVMNYSHILK